MLTIVCLKKMRKTLYDPRRHGKARVTDRSNSEIVFIYVCNGTTTSNLKEVRLYILLKKILKRWSWVDERLSFKKVYLA